MIRLFKNILHLAFGFVAAVFYRFPGKKMIVIGITGTSGKTTTTHLIYEILRNSGIKVSMLSTVKAVIDNKEYDTGFHVTTPSSFMLQKLMRKAKDSGSEIFILEVTSHALDQNRIYGSSVDLAVFTNITHEHLDYHKTYDKYVKAKAKLMDGVKYSILNKDDKSYPFLLPKTRSKIVTYSLNKTLMSLIKKVRISPNLPGKFNLYNISAAVAVCKLLRVKRSVILKTVSEFKGIPGRMEVVKINKPYTVIIDFAHKPDALEQVLKTVGATAKNQIIVVFGCAGLRDREKRPMMGEIAAKLADITILTAEDPRTEDVRDIIKEISAGCIKGNAVELIKNFKSNRPIKNDKHYFIRIPDRQEAINYAIRHLASKGDVILLCGKGHEQSLCYGDVEYPWDEKKAVKKAIYGTV
jgi:UDP-N-acetylmuramoyl-L-alanyl-D-glutamate--2,6-diaminopimelate ligase